ncbi:MAG: 50S ribosomal protein L25/general stress protein Ctc [Bacteroidales bacterium]|nr:50S ribosomal protein L25/general stress protein Ctc [Bacteroidales bacterium]
MQTVSLSGSLRGNVGKKDAKALRQQGLVPCVLYGGKEQFHFHLDEKDFKKIVYTPETYLVKLKLGDNEIESLLQDIQYHPVTDKILHADFMEIFTDKPVKVAIPVHPVGASEGVLKGGSLNHILRKLIVKAYVKDIPDGIDIDISGLDIGDSVKISDLNIDKLTFLDPENRVILSVKVTRMAVDVEEEEEEEEGVEGEEGEGVEGGEKPAEGGEKPAEGGKKPAEGGEKPTK